MVGEPPQAGAVRRLTAVARVFGPAVVFAFAVVAAGCQSSDEPDLTIRQTTEDLIRTAVADQVGLGDLSPICPEVEGAAVGLTWQCTATSAEGQVVALDAVINSEGQIELATTNVITSMALPTFEQAAVQALNTTVGSQLADEAIDCGEASVVFDPAQVDNQLLVCALLDPHTEQTYDVTLNVNDIEGRQFSLVVADEPRA